MAHILVFAKKKPLLDTAADRISIGTRTSCELTLRDPIAAEVHCHVVHQDLVYRIEDAGTATGTFVNGLAIAKPTALASGDEIVLGVNKLVVEIVREENGFALHLDLQEDKFFQKARFSTGDDPQWIPGDREAFKEAEINFSAFPALRVAGWSAVSIALLALLLLLVPGVRATLVQPGPLHNLHGQILAAEGCIACHEPWGGVTSERCRSCHAVELEGRHPFDGALAAALPADACTRCHVEHLGSESVVREVDALADVWPGVAPRVRERDPLFVPRDFRSEVGCAGCHHVETPTLEDARRFVAEHGSGRSLSDTGRLDQAARATPAVAKFDHASHVGERKIECAHCHRPADSAEVAESRRDFAVVPFTTCMGCHHAEGNTAYGELAVVTDSAASGAPPFRVDWHGKAEERCLACHAELEDGSPALVETESLAFQDSITGAPIPPSESPRLLFSLESRGHDEQAGAKGRDCSECHAAGDFASAKRVDRRFWHALHLAELPAGADDVTAERARALSAACSECHADVVASASLTGMLFDGSTCARCHASSANGESTPAISERVSRTKTMRTDFPHALHVARADGSPSLAKGCFACHAFESASDGFRAVPATPSEVVDCTACHDDHANVGGGSCNLCHAGSDPLFFGGVRAATGGGSFSHFQPGHVESVRDCRSCHAGVESAALVADIGMPDASGEGCFECHFEERFHWR